MLSCNKEEVGSISINQETEKEKLASFIGKQHNLFVADFYQKFGKIPSSRTTNTEESNSSVGEELHSYIFEYSLPGYIESDVITAEEAEEITPFIEEQLHFLTEIAENTPEFFFKLSLDNALQLETLSNKTHEFILSNINGDIDLQTINYILDSYIQSNELDIKDLITLDIFKEVLNNSAEYWNTEEASSTRGWLGLGKSSWVILADAAGAAIGTAAAGVGSIILGAAWSIVVNESNQDEISSSDDEYIIPIEI